MGNPESSLDFFLSLHATEMNLGNGGFDFQKKFILLIDDVFTTGATVNECSKVLLTSGAHRVDVLTLAHAVKRI